MNKKASIQIARYQPWMFDQVVNLFVEQYDIDRTEFSKSFIQFYETSYQLKRCVRLVALEGETVAGFQSFFAWPYMSKEKVFNSYQSGNSIVSPSFRGKGIFQSLLNSIQEDTGHFDFDFIMGFPVDQSMPSFLKRGWDNPFNLTWTVALKNPLGYLYNRIETQDLPTLSKALTHEYRTVQMNDYSDTDLRLSNDQEFQSWRITQMTEAPVFFYFEQENFQFQLELKVRRSYGMNELIIGRVDYNEEQEDAIRRAFREFNKVVKSDLKMIAFVSFATNPHQNVSHLLNNSIGIFRKSITRKINFITWQTEGHVTDKGSWRLFRGDIDTW